MSVMKGWKFRCNYAGTFNCANCKREILYRDTYWSYYDTDEYCNKCGDVGSKSMAATVSIVKIVKMPKPPAKTNGPPVSKVWKKYVWSAGMWSCKCFRCGTVFTDGQKYSTYDGERYCEHCAKQKQSSQTPRKPTPTNSSICAAARANGVSWTIHNNIGASIGCRDCNTVIQTGDMYWTSPNAQVYCSNCGRAFAHAAAGMKTTSPTTTPTPYKRGKVTPMSANVICDSCATHVPDGDSYWFRSGTNTSILCDACMQSGVKAKVTKPAAPQTPIDWEPYVIYSGVPCSICKKKILRGANSFRKVDQQGQVMIFRHKACHEAKVVATNAPMSAPASTWQTFKLIHSGSCGQCLAVFPKDTVMMRRPRIVKGSPTGQVMSYQVMCIPCLAKSQAAAQSTFQSRVMRAINPPAGWPFTEDDRDDESVPPKYIDVGTAPTKVQCACFGMPHYDERVEREIEVWIPHLKVLFGEPPVGCSFKQASIIHEGGCKETTVRLYYRPDFETCVAYADKVNTGIPARWEITKDSPPDVTPKNLEEWLKDGWHYKLASNSCTCKRCGCEIVMKQSYYYHPDAHTAYNLICSNCLKTLTGA